MNGRSEPSRRRRRRGPARVIRESWDVVLGIFGLCGVTATWLSPALGFPELQTVTAWVVFGGAAGIFPASRVAEAIVSRTTSGAGR